MRSFDKMLKYSIILFSEQIKLISKHKIYNSDPKTNSKFPMSNVKHIRSDDEFRSQLSASQNDLVVIDFFTTWCGPCRHMEGVVASLALKYPSALFLKVDADLCFESAMSHDVKGVPLFVIYRNLEIVDFVQGAQAAELDRKIGAAELEHRRWKQSQQSLNRRSMIPRQDSLVEPTPPLPPLRHYPEVGPIVEILSSGKFLEKSRVLNDLEPSSMEGFLSGKKMCSGRGTGKLCMYFSFKEKLMLHSFAIKAKAESGPKVLRFFANHPKLLDFGVAVQLAPSQEVTLCAEDLSGERRIELRSGAFNYVTSLQIFVTDGLAPAWRTQGYYPVVIDKMHLFGAPILSFGEEAEEVEKVTATNYSTSTFVEDSGASTPLESIEFPPEELTPPPDFEASLNSLATTEGFTPLSTTGSYPNQGENQGSEVKKVSNSQNQRYVEALFSDDIRQLIEEQEKIHQALKEEERSPPQGKRSRPSNNNVKSKRSSSNSNAPSSRASSSSKGKSHKSKSSVKK